MIGSFSAGRYAFRMGPLTRSILTSDRYSTSLMSAPQRAFIPLATVVAFEGELPGEPLPADRAAYREGCPQTPRPRPAVALAQRSVAFRTHRERAFDLLGVSRVPARAQSSDGQ